MLGLTQIAVLHVLIASQLSKKLKRIYVISMTVNVSSVWFLSMNHNDIAAMSISGMRELICREAEK